MALSQHVHVFTTILQSDTIPPPVSQMAEQALIGLSVDLLKGGQVKLSPRRPDPQPQPPEMPA